MRVDELLEKLEKVRARGGNNWLACCPHHPDRKPSLAIRELDDGRILIKCFAGCPPVNILGSIGLTLEALFPERLPENSYKPMRRPFAAPDVLAALGHEITVIRLAAFDLSKGKALSQVDQQRLAQASSRIAQAGDWSDGEHR